MTDHYEKLTQLIKQWGAEAGFQETGITDIDTGNHKHYLSQWLDAHYHGEMDYMQRHKDMRQDPSLLLDGSLRCISFRMDHYTDHEQSLHILDSSDKAYIARYALGRDYHKMIRKRIATIAERIEEWTEKNLQQRAFVDSAPVLERAFAEKAGLGWIGKNTMLINSKAGSFFFLGELLTNLPLSIDQPKTGSHCGSCQKCLVECPTNAFIGPHILDARKCISYLTIELKTAIPEELRPLMGNRVFGCDDCQLVCPWNKFTQQSSEADFTPRHALEDSELLTLFQWSEKDFMDRTAGSPIRRIGFSRWQRNLAVGLGNAPFSNDIIVALEKALPKADKLVADHIIWAINRQKEGQL